MHRERPSFRPSDRSLQPWLLPFGMDVLALRVDLCLPRLHASRAETRWRVLGFRPEILAAGPVHGVYSSGWHDALPGCRLPRWVSRTSPVPARTGRSGQEAALRHDAAVSEPQSAVHGRPWAPVDFRWFARSLADNWRTTA
jgi:hypothetical protein